MSNSVNVIVNYDTSGSFEQILTYPGQYDEAKQTNTNELCSKNP